MSWTEFHDMSSGGGSKEPWRHIAIEAVESEARLVFWHKFGHNPDRVTCTCCGPDYSVMESNTLEDVTAYERKCEWDNDAQEWVENQDSMRLEEFLSKAKDWLVIRAVDIKPEEREGEVPVQGYVWHE
jgi:hypothetical protein